MFLFLFWLWLSFGLSWADKTNLKRLQFFWNNNVVRVGALGGVKAAELVVKADTILFNISFVTGHGRH